MLDELSFGCKVAWVAVVFTFMFVFLPATVPSTNTRQDAPPKKEVYNQALLCYKGELGNGSKKLICDYPATPTGLIQPQPNR
jgi:hypothetical protein